MLIFDQASRAVPEYISTSGLILDSSQIRWPPISRNGLKLRYKAQLKKKKNADKFAIQ